MRKNIVGSKIKEYRMQHGLTQAQLSKKMIDNGVHMDQKILSQIEINTRCVYDYELVAFIKIFNVNIEDLLE